MEEKIQEMLDGGLNCAQVVLRLKADEHCLEAKQAEALALLFGRGMGYGSICGCVSGAYMAIGLAAGNEKQRARRLKQEFDSAFSEEFGSLICDELLQTQSESEEARAARQGRFSNSLCPQIMLQTCLLLEELLQ